MGFIGTDRVDAIGYLSCQNSCFYMSLQNQAECWHVDLPLVSTRLKTTECGGGGVGSGPCVNLHGNRAFGRGIYSTAALQPLPHRTITTLTICAARVLSQSWSDCRCKQL